VKRSSRKDIAERRGIYKRKEKKKVSRRCWHLVCPSGGRIVPNWGSSKRGENRCREKAIERDEAEGLGHGEPWGEEGTLKLCLYGEKFAKKSHGRKTHISEVERS